MLTDAHAGVNLSDGPSPGVYVACGTHAAAAFLETRPRDVKRILLARSPAPDLASKLARVPVGPEIVDRDALSRASFGVAHQGIVTLGTPPPLMHESELVDRKLPVVLAVDEVSDPRNVGAMMRTAEAAGASAVALTRDRSPGLSPALVKSAAGSIERLPLLRVTNLSRLLLSLREAGYWIIGLDGLGEVSLFEPGAIPGFPVCLVLGSEGRGIRPLVRRACHRLVRVPMEGKAHSLNVSVAAALGLYETLRQRASQP